MCSRKTPCESDRSDSSRNCVRYCHRSIKFVPLAELRCTLLNNDLVVIIPIWILRKYRRSSRQKIGMGVFLCLNASQAVVAIIRMAGIKSRFTLDHTWNDFFQQIEASIAISMISVTAFRSFFVAERSRARARRYQKWYSTPMKILTGSSNSRSQPYSEEDRQRLPEIPSATLTGVRTAIRRGGLESRWEPEPMRAGDLESQRNTKRDHNAALRQDQSQRLDENDTHPY